MGHLRFPARYILVVLFYQIAGCFTRALVNPHLSAVDSLRGMLKDVPSDIDLNSLREERLTKYEDHVCFRLFHY